MTGNGRAPGNAAPIAVPGLTTTSLVIRTMKSKTTLRDFWDTPSVIFWSLWVLTAFVVGLFNL